MRDLAGAPKRICRWRPLAWGRLALQLISVAIAHSEATRRDSHRVACPDSITTDSFNTLMILTLSLTLLGLDPSGGGGRHLSEGGKSEKARRRKQPGC